jgi:hypothetical protein
MKSLLAIAIAGISTISNAETLSFPLFQIEVGSGWVHNIERESPAYGELGQLIAVYDPNGNGILRFRSYIAPGLVNPATLRNMTIVESSTTLNWREWGDYSGYQYDHAEGGSFFRQWWLTNERTIIFIVYESSTQPGNLEIDEVDKIVNSIAVNTSRQSNVRSNR